MTDTLSAAIEWARDHGVSPWIVVWLVAFYLGLRLLAMIGRFVSRTASGIWERYDTMLKSLEQQLADARREAAEAKAAKAELARELERAQALIDLQRQQLAMRQAPPLAKPFYLSHPDDGN